MDKTALPISSYNESVTIEKAVKGLKWELGYFIEECISKKYYTKKFC